MSLTFAKTVAAPSRARPQSVRAALKVQLRARVPLKVKARSRVRVRVKDRVLRAQKKRRLLRGPRLVLHPVHHQAVRPAHLPALQQVRRRVRPLIQDPPPSLHPPVVPKHTSFTVDTQSPPHHALL